jgi:hypothetical protein
VINSASASFSLAGYRFPREVIAVAVRWYLRYGLSYRDVEELLAERGITVDGGVALGEGGARTVLDRRPFRVGQRDMASSSNATRTRS